MNHQINRLLQYGLYKELIQEEDVDYATNLLLDVLQLREFTKEEIRESLETCTPILEEMLDFAVENNLIEDTFTARDLFDTRIMNCVMPRPSEIVSKFTHLYQISPKEATDYYYDISIASNYIRKNRTDRNIQFTKYHTYGDFEITINLSKPEKDPREIASAKEIPSSTYPNCLLCKENVGFAGDIQKPARQTHRIIPLSLQKERYYLQYSPYVYYREHCIIFNQKHKPMVINEHTFTNLLALLDVFPHYMIGSNADLPIVGGSILSHDHFQGGKHHFPIEDAKTLTTLSLTKFPNLTIELLYWPLSTIRVSSKKQEEIAAFAKVVLEAWKNYDNETLDILAYSDTIRHNTITPIARKKKERYQMDLVLRNNRTNKQYPDGIFHPHPHLHHIKKENIGLIEVMGLAILPARLKTELEQLKLCLLNKEDIYAYPELEKHQSWYIDLKNREAISEETIDSLLQAEVAKKFVEVLENAGVFKMNETGIEAFKDFVISLDCRG